ncbi:Transposon Ty3-I Gag-Pol polyprotein [Gossypium australe]|uniref:Transposon Ty3-I Gag-Pol polyprotein n=1 Tax=Gossypium australe TaxID=47621 RepID=A0A5B6UMN4_9ROSI|nr:Transposon Ty3-I Gag-Pol polyprotein [Gossypium australe]
MHRILLEGDAKPSRESQRGLNLAVKEMVIKEIHKLLNAGIINPISDREWKKTEIIMVRNLNNELVPMRAQNGWRMSIDFRKLNQVTRKDHFPPTFHRPNVRKVGWKILLLFSLCFFIFFIKSLLHKKKKR